MADPAEILMVIMTALILPAIAILVTAFLLGSLESMESVKYVVLLGDEADPDADDAEAREPDETGEEREWAT